MQQAFMQASAVDASFFFKPAYSTLLQFFGKAFGEHATVGLPQWYLQPKSKLTTSRGAEDVPRTSR